MNAQHEIDRLLDESGAVLVRQNNHLVYRLPNGRNFVAPKTSSDPERAARNGLSELRRALGIVRLAPKTTGEPKMSIEEAPATPAPAAAPAPEPESLKDRIETAIANEESAQERLLAEAQAFERRLQMLKALLPFAADPAAEDALRAIMPSVQAPSPPPPGAQPGPPQQITERVQVTRQLVLAATQTFQDTFTVNEIGRASCRERV